MVEVVERAEAYITGLWSILDLPRIGGEYRANAQLKIRQGPIEDLHGKESPIRAAPLERQPRASLDSDLTMGNGVSVLHASWAILVEITVVNGPSLSHRHHEDNED